MQQAQPTLNDSRLPRAVRRQAARANEILAQKQRGSEVDPAAPETPPATPSDPAAAPPVVAQPATPTATTDPRRADPAYWEQRLAAVNGILRKEREQRRESEEGLHQRIVELEEEVATLKEQQSAPSSSSDLGKYFTPEQVERIGEDEAMSMALAADKAAQTAVAAAVAKIEASLKPERDARKRDAERETAQKRRDFLAAVEAEVPDLYELNDTPGWHQWLAQRDGESAFTRQQSLDRYQANTSLDAPAVIALFKAYKATLPKTPAPPVAPTGDTVPGGGPVEQPKPGLKPLSKQEIKDFYKAAALNKVTDQQRVEFEARRAITPAGPS